MVDYVLPGRPLPGRWAELLHLPERGMPLLAVLAIGVLVVSLAGSLVSLWGRAIATLSTKRVQVAIRRRVFRHAAQLPLHRVYQLKSGGVSSILREDAGGIGDLIFALLYNPWRAVIQLIGSICVLTWVDWRLLAASLVLVPGVYLSHRAWISRIRPLYRHIRTPAAGNRQPRHRGLRRHARGPGLQPRPQRDRPLRPQRSSHGPAGAAGLVVVAAGGAGLGDPAAAGFGRHCCSTAARRCWPGSFRSAT